MNEFAVEDLASCRSCRCLVCVVRYVGGPRRGQAVLWDPKFVERRAIVTAIGFPVFIARGQLWGAAYDREHRCPAAEVLAQREADNRDERIS